VSEYNLMPKMFHLDAYDDCLNENVKFSSSVFCVADVQIKPNKSSQVWNIIEKNSRQWKIQYRHDHLVYGVCINRCRKLLEKLGKYSKEELLMFKPENFSIISIDATSFYYSMEDEIEFGSELSACINYELKENFQLEANSVLNYCDIKGRTLEIGTKSLKFIFS
jgi:hypothetical protein